MVVCASNTAQGEAGSAPPGRLVGISLRRFPVLRSLSIKAMQEE